MGLYKDSWARVYFRVRGELYKFKNLVHIQLYSKIGTALVSAGALLARKTGCPELLRV